MDTSPVEKKPKPAPKNSTSAQIRVKKETRKRMLQDLARANKKDYGRPVRSDDYVALAFSKITSEDIRSLQDASLSNADRLDRDYREYVSKHGPTTKDEYLGLRLNGNLSKNEKPSPAEGGSDGTSNH